MITAIKKRIRILFGRCPYCSAKLQEGMGGSSILFLGGMKMCPSYHYAEELHYTGATIIYDDGGNPLRIKNLSEDKPTPEKPTGW